MRDPKLVAFGGQLLLYFLPNRHFPEPQPYTTLVASSTDGVAWDKPAPVEPRGWLLWKPKPLGEGLVVTAYWHEHGRAVLLRSGDGRRWEIVSNVVEGSSGEYSPLNIYDSDLTISAWVNTRGGGGTIVARAKPHYITYRLMINWSQAAVNVYAPGHHLVWTDEILA